MGSAFCSPFTIFDGQGLSLVGVWRFYSSSTSFIWLRVWGVLGGGERWLHLVGIDLVSPSQVGTRV